MTAWFFNDLQDPTKFEGFVYMISNMISGRMYIGRKYTYSTRHGKRKESNWRHYWGSCKALTADIKLLGKQHFKREILVFCISQNQANDLEEKIQRGLNVLNAVNDAGDRLFYNGTIGGKYFVFNGGYLSDEAKKRIGLAHKGKTVSSETRKLLSESRKGSRHSLETKKLMKKSQFLGTVIEIIFIQTST